MSKPNGRDLNRRMFLRGAAATVLGTVMLLFALVSLLVINLIQVWGQRYQGAEASA